MAEAYLSTRISQGIVATLRGQLFGRLLDQPVGFFTNRKAGDLLSRINTDIDGVEDVVTDKTNADPRGPVGAARAVADTARGAITAAIAARASSIVRSRRADGR